ncbi:single-stranded DNA-binding protein [Commensalibacter melissae]|uniref:single-stranded DNA-binding protein n=1 Tax=Commensalibacter melissae TaxID=2070537 RepID=UPI0018C20A57|nr:single-stranded DNA-binding protein [Commensalibacter melissae]
MSGSINKVIIVGRLGRDPELKSTKQGSKVALLSVATGERYRDKNTGETKTLTDWHRIVVFSDNMAGYAEKYLKKGDQVYMEGRIKNRTWDDNMGNRRYVTEIVVSDYKGSLINIGNQRRDQNSSGNNDGFHDDEIPF